MHGVEMSLLDAADVDFLRFEELLKFSQVSFVAPLLHSNARSVKPSLWGKTVRDIVEYVTKMK